MSRRTALLHAGARSVAEAGEVPRNREGLLAVPGIGRYTAGAVASIAHAGVSDLRRANVGYVIVRPGSGDESAGGGGPVSQGTRTVPASLVATLATVPGAARADGRITNFGTFVVGKDGKLIGGQGPPGIAVNHSDGPAANGIPSRP